jgi:monoamine oxidase
MGRTTIFRNVLRDLWVAMKAERRRECTDAALDLAWRARPTRRQFLAAGAASTVGLAFPVSAAQPRAAVDVGIVGAGLAGLSCAYELARAGIAATVYDAASRVGGRCSSLRGFFPGQVAELGGEFIDNPHKTMLGYARSFGLAREDVTKESGEVTYFFLGQHFPEAVVVDEFRAFVPAMRADLRRLSGSPTAERHNAADEELDRTSLGEYLVTRGAGPIAKAAISAAYLAEYGRETDEQSALNFLLFIHADRRAKFTPFGVFSDERWHIVDGNDRIAEGLAARLPRPVDLGTALVRVARRSDGRVELTFERERQVIVRTHDAVVLTLPFTVLRGVDLHASLALPDWKRQAIDELGYGTNAKMMVGFSGRPWALAGSNGTSYSDLPNHQTTWETNPSLARDDRAILTDYSSGARGAGLNPSQLQQEAARFLGDLDRVYGGALAAASRDNQGRVLARLEHWPSNPLTLGSYTCYLPGQFTTIAGREATPVGNLFFAGEHTDSFYQSQGFMEGAALSGIAAAAAVETAARAK